MDYMILQISNAKERKVIFQHLQSPEFFVMIGQRKLKILTMLQVWCNERWFSVKFMFLQKEKSYEAFQCSLICSTGKVLT